MGQISRESADDRMPHGTNSERPSIKKVPFPSAFMEPTGHTNHWIAWRAINSAFRQNAICLLGGVRNGIGLGLSRTMFAFSIHSGVTQQLPGAGDDNFRKRLYILELFDCILHWGGTDEIGIVTVQ